MAILIIQSLIKIAISGGIKILFKPILCLFILLSRLHRTLNPDIDINKTTLNLKLGLGAAIGPVDVILEYAYGLKYQRMVYDITVPFASTHRNSYLQLKAQVPVFNLRK
jgi:hypothetical protein